MSALPSSQLLFSLLLANACKTALLWGMAFAVAHGTRRKSAAFRHQIWALVIGGSILLPALQILMPAWPAPLPDPVARIWLPFTPPLATPSALHEPLIVNAMFAGPPHLDWTAWVVIFWLAGVVFWLLRLALGFAGLVWKSSGARRCSDTKLFADALPRNVCLLIANSPAVMPCTWGILRPRILLPRGCDLWPAQRRHLVLAHEMAHIDRRDWLVLLMAEAARALYWFHPLIWMAVHQLREASERACDDAVLATGAEPAGYAGELLEIVRTSCQSQAGALAIARPSTLERRFTAMLDNNVNRSRLTRGTQLFTATLTVLCLIPLAALRAPAQDVAGQFIGTVLDAKGAAVPCATVIMLTPESTSESTPGNGVRSMTATDANGMFRFEALPAGKYQLQVLRRGFTNFSAAKLLEPARSSSETVSLQAQIEPTNAYEQKIAAERNASPGGPSRVRIGSNVQAANLTTKVSPVYPDAAKASHIQQSVILEATIDRDGIPVEIKVLNPDVDPSLARSAVEAVSQWRYKPTLLNGNPVEVETSITVNYTLSQ